LINQTHRLGPDPAANVWAGAVSFLGLADPAFSVTSEQVRRARDARWYAHTSYGIAVLRHRQASQLISHPCLRQGSSAWPAHHGITSGPFAAWWANWVLNKEGADHRRLHKLMNPAFSRRVVAAARPRFRALATELVDALAGAAQCEFMADFAEPFAARAIAYMLGISEQEWPVIARESATIGLAMGSGSARTSSG
jgi:cytochrome P450